MFSSKYYDDAQKVVFPASSLFKEKVLCVWFLSKILCVGQNGNNIYPRHLSSKEGMFIFTPLSLVALLFIMVCNMQEKM